MVEISNKLKERIESFFEDVRFGYSGRGMYGEKCIGIVVSNPLRDVGGFFNFLVEHEDTDSIYEFSNMLNNVAKTDSMGLESIIYFPDYIIKQNKNIIECNDENSNEFPDEVEVIKEFYYEFDKDDNVVYDDKPFNIDSHRVDYPVLKGKYKLKKREINEYYDAEYEHCDTNDYICLPYSVLIRFKELGYITY